MKLTIFHPQGNANVRESAIGFLNSNLLEEYHTSIAFFPGSVLDKIGSIGFLSEIRRRKLDPILKPFTHTSPMLEIGRYLSQKAGFKSLVRDETSLFSVDTVTRQLDKKVASRIKVGSAVYAYEDGAYFSFEAAKLTESFCFYDLPTGYWRAKLEILAEQSNRFPDWTRTMAGLVESEDKLRRKDAEIKLADCIFVASQFTKTTLQQFPGNLPEVKVIPYGFPNVGIPKQYEENKNELPVKILFVGNLSQQKGIANLFKAADALGSKVNLTVIGRKPVNECSVLNKELPRHRWIPSLPHQEILQIMREHDILVFPTLFDGFGMVMTEAMSQGTPVLTTYNCAGPDIIEHGKNGWLINAGSTQMLVNVLSELIDNRDLIAKAGKEAMETARNRPWEVYRSELSHAIKDFVSTKKN